MTDRVRPAIDRALPELLGRSAVITHWEGPEQREWSWQFSIRVSGRTGGDLLLKIPRWEATPTLEAAIEAGEQDSTHAEIDGLRRIELAVLASGDPGLTAVEPIGYVAAVNGILMRRLAGESLRARLGRGRGSGDVAAIFGRVGRWIRVFHGIDGPAELRPFDAAAAVERSRALEDQVRSAGSVPGELLSAMAMVRLAAAEIGGVPEPWAEAHGDLNLSNILVGQDDRVAVVDPNREVGPALADPVRVITDAALESSQLVIGGITRPAAVLEEWERRLLEGVGFEGHPVLGFRLAEAAIERWAELESDLTGVARAGLIPGRPTLRRVVRRRLNSIL